MNNNIIIRPFKSSDIQEIIQLFRNAVHSINIRHYSQEQVSAWAPELIDAEKWQISLEKNIAFVAVINSVIVGFADMTHEGYLDRLYVHKDYQAKAIAYYLFKALEQTARELKLSKITTDCSITAKKVAERIGFVVIKEQTVIHNGVEFINYVMEKKLCIHS